MPRGLPNKCFLVYPLHFQAGKVQDRSAIIGRIPTKSLRFPCTLQGCNDCNKYCNNAEFHYGLVAGVWHPAICAHLPLQLCSTLPADHTLNRKPAVSQMKYDLNVETEMGNITLEACVCFCAPGT